MDGGGGVQVVVAWVVDLSTKMMSVRLPAHALVLPAPGPAQTPAASTLRYWLEVVESRQ